MLVSNGDHNHFN